jgi:hypothetical protein
VNIGIKISMLVLLLYSCTLTETEKKAMLPSSSGKLAELVIITDAQSADSGFKTAVQSVFSKSLEGQPPPGEEMFKVLFTDETFFKGYFQAHHHIFVFLTPEGAPALSKVIDPKLIDKLVKVIQNNPNSFGVLKEDLFATNQSVFFVLARNKAEMEAKVAGKKDDLLALALEHESKTGLRKLVGANISKKDSFYVQSIAQKGYAIKIPSTYKVSVNNENFTWLRKVSTGKELAHNIILFSVPYTSKEELTTAGLLKIRNEFTQKYIPGPTDGSYLGYSTILKPYREDEVYKGRYSSVIRGWWDVKGDFMGGPSYLRVVLDEQKGRLIFAEGFLYYPNERKVAELRELEVLVNSLTIK